ncbi:hypothetical protein [Saccharolobus islandicus]|uniref:Uncharacterized protein n=1 Tax=Saccharolobus islandicus (strain M.14.25 / Kamchatka \|nr:hypothetical protein [Sulfolobus islandicus]ACP39463.1 conserved hypothetical protein [Sulfolobus islandicus M.14.25]
MFDFLLLFLVSLFPHAFVEYSVNVHVVHSNQVLNEIILEEVNDIYPNGNFQYNITIYVLNYSEVFPPVANYDNLSCPKTFFYVPNVSNLVINRAVILVLVNHTSEYYIYRGVSYIGYDEFEWYYYINSSGVPYKIVLFQKNEYGSVVSITTYTLIRSNIINSEETPIIPKDFKSIKGSSALLSEDLNNSLNKSVGGYILLADLILIPLMIGVGIYANKHKRNTCN